MTPDSIACSTIATLRLASQGIANSTSPTPLDVVTQLGAIQAQDYPGALWTIGLRTLNGTRAEVEQAIVERAIIRTWPMRGTLHFVPALDARWMLELLAPRILKGAAGRHRQLELDAATFKRSRTLIAKALRSTPVMTRGALFATLDGGGVMTTGQRGIHILRQLCMECTLCHGPQDEKQPTFTVFDEWIKTSRTLDRDNALRTIAERYFTSHGPASLRDFVWWTGLTVANAKIALHLAQPSLEKQMTEQGELWMAAKNAPSIDEGRAHLLPGFDEYLLGYTDRSAVLSARDAGRIVPGANGVFLSTLVLDGQVRGTWRRTTGAKGVSLALVPFTRLSAADKKAFREPVERFARYLGTSVSASWPVP